MEVLHEYDLGREIGASNLLNVTSHEGAAFKYGLIIGSGCACFSYTYDTGMPGLPEMTVMLYADRYRYGSWALTTDGVRVTASVNDSGTYYLVFIRGDPDGRMNDVTVRSLTLKKKNGGNTVSVPFSLKAGDRVLLLDREFRPVCPPCGIG